MDPIVIYLRSGGNIQVAAAQLGHRDTNLTLKKYGRFMPSVADRAKMEEQAADYETKRRSAAGGARGSGGTLTEAPK